MAASRLPGPDYTVSVVFRAPLAFAYRWCTDFTPDDARLEGETYTRRILHQDRRRVVFEDLESSPAGWHWSRCEVALSPPDRWRMTSVGNYRSIRADYRLTDEGNGRTRFTLTFRRRPGPLPGPRLTRAARERAVTRAWRRFARALERDYRRLPRR